MKVHNPFRVAFVATLGVGLGLLFIGSIQTLSTILLYVGTALFLSLGLDPLVGWLERRGLPRWAAVLVTILGVLAAFAGVILIVVPVIVGQIAQLIAQVQSVVERADWDPITDVREWMAASFPALDVERFVPTTVEGSLAGSSRGGRASGVEPQNREVRESGQTTGRLPEDMGVHEPARGGERMTGHQGGDRVPVARSGEFADQGQTVDRLQFDVLPARGQKHRSTDLHLS